MTRHIPFPSIEPYRTAIKTVAHIASHTGFDAAGDPLYDESRPRPVLTFTGTVKLHGINVGVNSGTEGIWYQTREAVITPTADLKAFAKFAEGNRDAFEALFARLRAENEVARRADAVITIFGEWCGQGVQQGVAISQLPKSFFIFAAKVTTPDGEAWVDSSSISCEERRIFNVDNYTTYRVCIDFNTPEAAQDELAAITARVEAECPVAKAFGISGVGEGVVWTAEYDGEPLRFKVKGEQHSVVKATAVAAADTERQGSIDEFVAYTVTANRLAQAVCAVCGDAATRDVTRLGDVIRWMQADIAKEESDTLAASGFTLKDVSGPIAAKSRELFLGRLPG